ncbi:MAG: hypothetical protein P1U86_05720 [Verrucomicrobiales bacterium]|nr:hypothetical protein [Verrucomicrobiales bacterium]
MKNKSNIEALCELITDRKDHLALFTRPTEGHWNAMLRRLNDFRIAATSSKTGCHDEEIWTFLTSLAYADSGLSGNKKLFQLLTESDDHDLTDGLQWLEPLPLPPRNGEGNTNLDLALGGIRKRKNTSHGIEYDGTERPIVFCEMKWFSDLSYGVSGDPHRNQLIRVIENALTFQNADSLPSTCHVTLVTPREFKSRTQGSRFYQYKFEEYSNAANGAEAILSELDSCRLNPYTNQGWKYPEESVLKERVENLNLHWVTFEDLIVAAPDNELANHVRLFEKAYNHTSQR